MFIQLLSLFSINFTIKKKKKEGMLKFMEKIYHLSIVKLSFS